MVARGELVLQNVKKQQDIARSMLSFPGGVDTECKLVEMTSCTLKSFGLITIERRDTYLC